MIRLYSILFIVFFSTNVLAQVPGERAKKEVPDTLLPVVVDTTKQRDVDISRTIEISASTTEQALEAVTEGNDDNETEDDSYLQQLRQYMRDPVNLNTADEATLKELIVLSPIQIQSLITYREVFGNLINIYELQAVPSWNIATIQKLRPYVTVRQGADAYKSFFNRFSGGTSSILVRVTQVLEESKGYKTYPKGDSSAHTYPGSPQKLFVRYKYVYKNLLQFGIVGEKDAGEEFFRGSQKLRFTDSGLKGGFDFYSIHLFARNLGIIKSLALGDFTVNMGQGLTSWQSLAFKKSPDVLNIKRQSAVLRPYNSAAEVDFHRGIGVTLGNKHWEATAFASSRNLDGNFDPGTDSSQSDDDIITSLQTSGYHRTKSELADKGILKQVTFGGNAAYNNDRLHVGFNAVNYHFGLPLNKSPEPYNLYALSGTDFANYSIDYSYTYKNVHYFGEVAANDKSYKAFMNGLLVNVDEKVDMSFLYRNISKGYQSLYTNAFTEGTYPTNEKGLYTGLSIKPNSIWRLDAYADFFKFPWLKYQVDAPSKGVDYMVQAAFKPNKQFEMYLRYRSETKQENYNPDGSLTLPGLIAQPKQSLRSQFSTRISQSLTFRNRVEMVWFDKRGPQASKGYLGYVDLLYKPIMKKYSGNIRLQYYESDDYNSRMYAYENDVLYSFSIPVFYLKGFRYYVNVNYDVTKRLAVWVRWAQYVVGEGITIGSGNDEIDGRTKTEVKLQMLYIFR